MFSRAFVIGDVHGMIAPLRAMLSNYQPNEERLIFVGDYIDRGTDSRATLLLIHELNCLKNAVCLKGNHEQLLQDYLLNPQDNWLLYYHNKGATTIADLLTIPRDSIEENQGELYAEEIKNTYPWLLPWLQSLPLYTEFGQFIIAHAGIDLTLADWRQTELSDFYWIREPFIAAENTSGRQIIFGHTPTFTLQDAGGVFQRDGKIGIDGGAVYGRKLIGLKINQQTIEEIIQYDVTKGEIV